MAAVALETGKKIYGWGDGTQVKLGSVDDHNKNLPTDLTSKVFLPAYEDHQLQQKQQDQMDPEEVRQAKYSILQVEFNQQFQVNRPRNRVGRSRHLDSMHIEGVFCG